MGTRSLTQASAPFEGAPPPKGELATALTDVVAALQESTSIRMEIFQERFFHRVERAALRWLGWAACGLSALAAWVGAQVSLALWISGAQGRVVAALCITGIQVLAAVVFFGMTRFITARSRARESAAP